MRVLVLDAAAGDHGAAFGQRGDDALVGVALLAAVVDDAGAVEAGRILGVEAGVVDGIGDRRVDAEGCELAAGFIQISKSSRPWPGAVWTKPVPASSVT